MEVLRRVPRSRERECESNCWRLSVEIFSEVNVMMKQISVTGVLKRRSKREKPCQAEAGESNELVGTCTVLFVW